MYHGHFLQHGPLFVGLGDNVTELSECHAIVGLVVQTAHGPAARLIAHCANKGVYSPGGIGLHGNQGRGDINGLVGDGEVWGHVSSSADF